MNEKEELEWLIDFNSTSDFWWVYEDWSSTEDREAELRYKLNYYG